MRVLFTGARVFDGTDGELRDGDVVVEDGRIVDVGIGLDGDEVVSAGGHTILPGLFDCHVHVMFTLYDFMGLLEAPFSYPYYQAARNLRSTIDVGITTVRDAAGADLGLKRAVEDGLVAGPRMHISINGLSQTGGHNDHWMACGVEVAPAILEHSPGVPKAVVDGPEAVRQRVRELIRAGADVIKVATSGGLASPRSNPHHAHFQPDELEMMVREAAAAGIPVMAHAHSPDGVKNAVRAGIRSVEHGCYLDDEAIELMLERGTYLVPTLLAPVALQERMATGMNAPQAWVDKAQGVVEAHQVAFAKALDAGVRIAMGTDAGVMPHGDNLRELELMAKGGMRPADVLLATTRTSAELMGLDVELGTIEPGKRADLVLVDGDAFEFSTLAERIAAVYKDGVRVV